MAARFVTPGHRLRSDTRPWRAHRLRDFSRIAQRAAQAGCIGQRLLGLGCAMLRRRVRGMTAAEQFEPLQRRLGQALQSRRGDERIAPATIRRCPMSCQPTPIS